MKPQKYKLKNGEERWQFQIFIGRNPITGKQIKKTRMGFKSPIEATSAYEKMLEERQNGAYTLESLAVERAFSSSGVLELTKFKVVVNSFSICGN